MEEYTNISLPLKKGRGRWDIVRDILTATLEEGTGKKTRIMQKAFLDWRTFSRYFEYLLNDEFLTDCNEDEYFTVTDKGRELLERLKSVEDVLDHA